MAKKAGGNNTTTWVCLLDARALVVRVYGATHLAERLLVEWLGEGRVRWSCKLFEAARVSELAALGKGEIFCIEIPDVAYSNGDPAFWRIGLKINWEESWAHETFAIGGNKAYGVRVAREDVLALLPEEHEGAATSGSSKERIAAEVERRVAAGGRYATITELSRSLSEWMKAISDQPLRPRSIENLLRELGLWPLPPKK